MPARRPDPPARRHRWWRWTVAATFALVVLIAVTVRVYVGQQHSALPLRLPTGQDAAATGPVSGTWDAVTGSVAGFRVTQRAFGASSVVVGRTGAVSGAVVAAGSTITSAAFEVTLTEIRIGGKSQPQLAASLSTGAHPIAVIRLASPLALSPAFASGGAMHAEARGVLRLNGVSRSVTVSLDARRFGAAIEVAGSIPVAFATWHISQPSGFGWFGSLADHGTAEFLLILHRAQRI